MSETFKTNLKRHLASAGITFSSVFLLTLGAELHAQVATVDPKTWGTALFLGLVITSARTACKAVYEIALGWLTEIK